MTCGVSLSEESLYKTARFCPVSLTYYGFCLRKGSYTVELHFAETIYTRDEYYSNLGTRIFDVYIQVIIPNNSLVVLAISIICGTHSHFRVREN